MHQQDFVAVAVDRGGIRQQFSAAATAKVFTDEEIPIALSRLNPEVGGRELSEAVGQPRRKLTLSMAKWLSRK